MGISFNTAFAGSSALTPRLPRFKRADMTRVRIATLSVFIMIPPLHDLVVFLITVCLVVASGFPGAHSWLYRNPPIFPVGSLLGLSAKPFAPATNLRSKAERGVSPLAPQERPSRFDFNCQRANFSCRRQCVSSKDSAIVQYSANCPYWNTYHGFTRHMSITELPRLITKVLRGTYRH